MSRPSLHNVKVAAIFVAIVCLGLALSTLTYLRGRSVNETTTNLVDGDLPAFDGLANLKIAIIEGQLALYKYYATLDRDAFTPEYALSDRETRDGLALLRRTFPDKAQAAEIAARYENIEKHSMQLDRTLAKADVDWDRARMLLNNIDGDVSVITSRVDELLKSLRDTVYERGDLTRARVAEIVGLVIAFSIAVAALLALAGYSLRAYLKEVRARKELSLFPEHNPHPILSVSRDGSVLYANPGARKALAEFGIPSAKAALLLPPDLSDRLTKLQRSKGGYDRFEYETHGHTFDCQIHALPEQDIFHIYLSDISAHKQAERRLIHFAYHDSLTGLPNRYKFEEALSDAIAKTAADIEGAAVLFSIDRFRLVVESYGRQTGDEVIKAAARCLNLVLQELPAFADSQLFRMDGAQFAVLVPRLVSSKQLDALMDALRRDGQRPVSIRDRDFFISFSMGASIFPRHGTDDVSVIKNADSALEHIRKLGGNDYLAYTEVLNVDAQEFLQLESELRHAEEQEEFEVFFQPQIEIATGTMIGCEALLRWRHPKRGLILPQRFISVAEQSGLIVPIGEWVLRSACAQARIWAETRLHTSFSVAVNVSVRQFATEDIPGLVERILWDTGLPARFLEIEITEGVAMEDVERTIATLGALQELGVKITIDDFGTGYSSLSYLKRFPVTTLKIDQSFVHNMTQNENDAAITQAVVALARSLKLRVIAEGVETEQQRRLLATYGCDAIQGYLVGPPVPAAELSHFFTSKRAART
jgi:diguanylate cyclase (GGDEF)-like protein